MTETSKSTPAKGPKYFGGEVDRFEVLEVAIAATQIAAVIARIESWISQKGPSRYVVLGGMHGLMEGYKSEDVRRAMQGADLVVADGMPLVWLGRMHGWSLMKRRVYGPELMLEFFQQTNGNYRHFFYGGNDGVAERLAKRMSDRFGIQVAGTITPPFRVLKDDELRVDAKVINESGADVVWVGISTPKQEQLMNRMKPMINCAVLLGVGAAFDFNSGLKPKAPRWIQDHGFEWAFRLISEPRRLWYRYLVLGPQFVILTMLDFIKQKIK